ncbi:hypothetical protein V8E51_016495 [Hyaloscypha variabilis]
MDSTTTIYKRLYQACDNCRAKRVRCLLGSVDQPQDPPCGRCKRENKECVFSSTRRKRARVEHSQNQNAQYGGGTSTAVVTMQHDYSPISKRGSQSEPVDSQQTLSALLDHEALTSNDALEALHEAFQNCGKPHPDGPSPGSRNDFGNRSRNEAAKNDIALNAWNCLRFVRTGLFTAGEALFYVTCFYTHLVPFSPVPSLRYKDPLQHMKLIEEEPVLALTILTLSARWMKLSGPGAVTRGQIIHDRLWNYLRSMITSVFWSEESFLSENTTNPETAQRSVLRTVGTCEALLLLLEWHPRTLHFPMVDNDTNSIIVRDGSEKRSHVATEVRYGRMRSGLYWLSRSDRMCWSLLGLAQTLAVELGLFEKQDMRHSGEDIERANRIQQLLWVFSIQSSGRLGWKYLSTLSMERQPMLASVDDTSRCWVGVASCLKKGHELLFSTPKQTSDIINKREYDPLLRILQKLLDDWRRDFDTANLSKSMRRILAIEYEHVRVYVYSIVLQAVIERRRKEKDSPSDQISRIDGQREETDELYDGLYLGYLTDAARSLLRVVVDEIFSEGGLLYVPVRTYSRILSAALYLLKTCAIEVKESEARKSLDLVSRTAEALQSSVVDDVHLSTHWGELLANLCTRLSSKPTQTATAHSDSGASQQVSFPSDIVWNPPTPAASNRKSTLSIPSSSSPSNTVSPMSSHTGLPYLAFEPAYVPDLATIQSSIGSVPQYSNYDDMFSWADSMSGMDITQMPWNGDQAMFDILASVVDAETQ